MIGSGSKVGNSWGDVCVIVDGKKNIITPYFGIREFKILRKSYTLPPKVWGYFQFNL
jgi:hypothetical protein